MKLLLLSLLSVTSTLSMSTFAVFKTKNRSKTRTMIVNSNDKFTYCDKNIRQNHCTLPNCRCSGEDIPGGLSRSQIPQMVFLTFDDAVNVENFKLYKDLFLNEDRRNPDGEPITATFFVSHEYTDYHMVHELWRHGHEIALHSISHKSPPSMWKSTDTSMWYQEIIEQRLQLPTLGKIPAEEIRGMRAPFLQIGGDAMYQVLSTADSGITWESSRNTNKRLWPYTNDYVSTQECRITPCPTRRYPGFWTVPMVDLVGDDGLPCAMADSCKISPKTANSTFSLLQRNFLTHYQGNRAPFGVFLHSGWLEYPWKKRGYIRFLDYLASLDDVYIVSISRALEWIKNPQPKESLLEEGFKPFQVDVKPSSCLKSTTCHYRSGHDGTARWLSSCPKVCPDSYPWVGNPLGD